MEPPGPLKQHVLPNKEDISFKCTLSVSPCVQVTEMWFGGDYLISGCCWLAHFTCVRSFSLLQLWSHKASVLFIVCVCVLCILQVLGWLELCTIALTGNTWFLRYFSPPVQTPACWSPPPSLFFVLPYFVLHWQHAPHLHHCISVLLHTTDPDFHT